MDDAEIMSLDEILQDPYYLNQFNEKIKALSDGTLNAESADGRKTGGIMSENITTAAGQDTTPGQAVTQVDMATIEQKAQERAERAAQTVVKDMLKQSGLDDAAIQSMLAEFKARQVTPEQAIQRLTKERDDGFATRDAELAALRQEKILRGHGLTDDEDIEIYGIRINKLVTEGKTFEQAASEYFTANPRSQKMPATVAFSGTGTTPMIGATREDFAKMSYMDRLKLKEQNPTQYEQFTSKN